MNFPYKIKFTPCNMKAQFITEIFQDHCFLELYENHVVFSAAFLADEPVDVEEKSKGVKNLRTDFTCVAYKSRVSGIEKSLMADNKRWMVAIIVYGFSDDIKIYFKTEKEAQNLHETLYKYFYGTGK